VSTLCFHSSGLALLITENAASKVFGCHRLSNGSAVEKNFAAASFLVLFRGEKGRLVMANDMIEKS